MLSLLTSINKKINGIIWSLLTTGIILMVLAVLIVWTDFMLRLVMGLLVIVIAYAFIFAAFRLWSIKKEIEDRYDFFSVLKKNKK